MNHFLDRGSQQRNISPILFLQQLSDFSCANWSRAMFEKSTARLGLDPKIQILGEIFRV